MKVRCKNIYNDYTKTFEPESHWLTIGKEYIVLEIGICIRNRVLYRLIGDNEDKSPGVYDANQFEIVEGSIPMNWKLKQSEETIEIGPTAWQIPGFWEDCYDGDPEALEIYKREARIIMEGSI